MKLHTIMSLNLRNCIRELTLISQIEPQSLREKVLESLSLKECLYKAIREVALNTIEGNVVLDTGLKAKLRPFADDIEYFETIGPNQKKKRIKAVVNSAGFLPILIPVVAAQISRDEISQKSGNYAPKSGASDA